MRGWFGCRLLALDLDGTLVRGDGSIAFEDRAAIRRAARAGVEIVLASARFPRGVCSLADTLGCGGTAICVDGAVLVQRGELVERRSIERTSARQATLVARGLGLRVIGFGSESVHCAAQDTGYLAYVEGWSRDCRRVVGPHAPPELVLWVALGTPERVAVAAESLRDLPAVALDQFAITDDCSALRLRAPGVDKGAALAALARTRGLDPAELAAVGNDYNDVPLLSAVGHGFAMGDSPAAVARAARHVLSATAATGGGVAEALARLAALRGQSRT